MYRKIISIKAPNGMMLEYSFQTIEIDNHN